MVRGEKGGRLGDILRLANTPQGLRGREVLPKTRHFFVTRIEPRCERRGDEAGADAIDTNVPFRKLHCGRTREVNDRCLGRRI